MARWLDGGCAPLLSAGLEEWVVRLGATAPFREAAEGLAALTGLELGAETGRRHAEAAARVERTQEAAEALRVEPGYFAANAERLDDPTLRLDGLPLGSGAIESAADHLVQRRLKRAGRRWSAAGGDALLALRARLRSRRPLTLPATQPATGTTRPARAA